MLYKRVTDLKNDCILYFVTFSNKTDTGLLLRDISVSSEVLWLVLMHYCFVELYFTSEKAFHLPI